MASVALLPTAAARMAWAVGAPRGPEGCGGSRTAKLPSAVAVALALATALPAISRSVTTTCSPGAAPKPQMLARAGACLVRAAQAQ